MLSGSQVYAANKYAALLALAEQHDAEEEFFQIMSELKSEESAEEAADAIAESHWLVRDWFDHESGNDRSAAGEFYQYVEEGNQETAAYDERESLLDKLERQLRSSIGLPEDEDDWPTERDGEPVEVTS